MLFAIANMSSVGLSSDTCVSISETVRSVQDNIDRRALESIAFMEKKRVSDNYLAGVSTKPHKHFPEVTAYYIRVNSEK